VTGWDVHPSHCTNHHSALKLPPLLLDLLFTPVTVPIITVLWNAPPPSVTGSGAHCSHCTKHHSALKRSLLWLGGVHPVTVPIITVLWNGPLISSYVTIQQRSSWQTEKNNHGFSDVNLTSVLCHSYSTLGRRTFEENNWSSFLYRLDGLPVTQQWRELKIVTTTTNHPLIQ